MIDSLIIFGIAMLITGSVAGVLAGLFGIGGGIVIVPVLEIILEIIGIDSSIRMHISIATSLAIIIPTSISSARNHYRHRAIDFKIIKSWTPFILFGALFGAWIASQVHSQVLAIIFAGISMLIALKMIFFTENRALTENIPINPFINLVPTSIGCLSSMMGIGGGTFSVMVLTLFNQSIHRAIGTAALLGLIISLPGTFGFIVAGWDDPRLPEMSLGYVNLIGFALISPMSALTAPVGVKVAYLFSENKLSKLFGLLLILIALRLFYRTLS
ncbi:MAG: hypothetical protein CMQ54_00175 [Gammaproteobacteria bacterium]|nr:hypothetical protein [Gammaproteobacteria bacterium]|tara:strand:+ start:1756 stop:2571 length:816 start_codon:yes stop_codon:yes gene_type:complete